jgi:hypothetical protein
MAVILANLIPWLESKEIANPWISFLLGIAGSTAIYSGAAKILSSLLESVRPLKELIFGKDDLQGTWTGMYEHVDHRRIYSVEHFEQFLDSLNIKGKGFTENGEVNSEWTSTASAIESKDKKLIYAYSCERYLDPAQFQGVCVFFFRAPILQ